jgi:hypothetical protein
MNKNNIIERMEYILGYLLSRKHNASVKIYFKKENDINGDKNQTRIIKEK